MELTKAYIDMAKFEQKRGRYDAQEVDAFLDGMAAEAERLQKELKETKEQLEKYRSMEGALASVMVTAEANAKKVEEEAAKKAEEILSQAEEEAAKVRDSIAEQEASLREQYQNQKDALIEEVEKLSQFSKEYRSAMREKLEGLLEQLQDSPAQQESGGIDLGDILKNLPETDSELKAMIDELI